MIASPAVDIAKQEMAANFFPGIAPEVLVNTIADYQALGCWERDTKISKESFDHLQDVFLYNELIGQRYEYDQVVLRY